MNKPTRDNPDRRRHRREKATIDHLVDHVYAPKEQDTSSTPATTDSGVSVEEQVRKEWDPKTSGGLPTF